VIRHVHLGRLLLLLLLLRKSRPRRRHKHPSDGHSSLPGKAAAAHATRHRASSD
jgi:hypothetical protein